MLKFLTVLSAILIAGTASAQDSGWTYKATLYGWVPAMTTSADTRFGTVKSSASGSDALSSLKGAFEGTLTARTGKWSFSGDLLYANLSNTSPTPLALYGDATVGVKLTALSGYAMYELSSDPSVQFDAGVGFRNFKFGMNVDLTAGSPPLGRPAAGQNLNANWTDPLIAARLTVPLSDKWFFSGVADFGGNGGGNQTYQIYTGVGYNFNSAWSTQLGYRYMDISHKIEGRNVKIGLSGALIAVSYSF